MKEDGSLLQLSGTGRKVEKRIQTGLFEKLLCEGCEKHLNSNFENSVHRLFESGAFQPHGVELGCDYFVQTDYTSFRLYMLSIIWRASVAESDPFRGFHLASHVEELIRAAIQNLNPLPPNILPFIVLSVEFDGGWTHEWVTMPVEGKAGEFATAFFIVGGLLICFVLEAAPNDELRSLFIDLDGIQRIRKIHVNDVAGLAIQVEVLKDRLNELDRTRGA